MINSVDLSKLQDQPVAIREAVAFYTAFTVLPTKCTAVERERHYATLEQAGYIEKVGGNVE